MKKLPLFLILGAFLGLEALVVFGAGIGSVLVLGISGVFVVLGGAGLVLSWSRFSESELKEGWTERAETQAAPVMDLPLKSQAPVFVEKPCPENEPATWTLETDVYEKALPALFQSITDYLNKTSEPMSESLVTIKTSMRDFIAQVHTHDVEITQASSLDAITGNVDRLQEHINQVAQESTQAFVVFGKEFQRLKDLLTSIFKLTGNISEIAERVHVLSINASIESARAGIHGRGFKVIAGEIQKLAHETQAFLKDIGGTVETSKEIFSSIDLEIDHNRTQMILLVQKEKTTFDSLNQTITRHYGQFKNLYSGILEFVSGLEGKMNNIFPVAMLLAIIIQEIENLHLVTGDYVLLLRELFTNSEGMCRDFDPIATVERLRKRLTTARELDALESVVKILGLQGKVDLKRNKDDYEMFWGETMKTIMLVDDSTSIRNILKNSLMGEYTIAEAENGKIALEKIKSLEVNLFLFDVNMPEMDGLTLLGEVRKLPQHKTTPILMLTTETKEELKQRGRELGASGWIVKPCDPERLLSAIKKLI